MISAVSVAMLCLAIADILTLDIVSAVVGSLIPLSSNIFHSILFSLSAMSLLYYVRGRRTSASFFVGWGISVFLISLSNHVFLFYPLSHSFNFIPDNSGFDFFIFFFGLILYYHRRKITYYLSSFSPLIIRKGVFLFFLAFFFFILFFPVIPLSVCNTLLLPNETKTITGGTVCSGVDYKYGSHVFYLCGQGCNISVWSEMPVDFVRGDNITISGVFTRKYRIPELYKIQWISGDSTLFHK